MGPVTTTSAVYPQDHPMSGRMMTVIATKVIHTRPWKNPTIALSASLGTMSQKYAKRR